MRPRIKVCGLTRMEDARLACELGADAVGFVFWPGSPRFVEPEQVRSIVAALPPFVTAVGVFVNQTPDYVARVADTAMLAAIQLHGDEDPAEFESAGRRFLKAVAVGHDFDLSSAVSGLSQRVTMLLDAHDPIRRGGTGRTIDWSVAAAVARLRPIVLSGGLTPANVGSAASIVKPYALDVSSGVESSPGIKDSGKMRDFFVAVGSADPLDDQTRPAVRPQMDSNRPR